MKPNIESIPKSILDITKSPSAAENIRLMRLIQDRGILPTETDKVREVWEEMQRNKG